MNAGLGEAMWGKIGDVPSPFRADFPARFHWRRTDARRLVGTPRPDEDEDEAKPRGLFVQAVLHRSTWRASIFCRGDEVYRFEERTERDVIEECELVAEGPPRAVTVRFEPDPPGPPGTITFGTPPQVIALLEEHLRVTSTFHFGPPGPDLPQISDGAWLLVGTWRDREIVRRWATSLAECGAIAEPLHQDVRRAVLRREQDWT